MSLIEITLPENCVGVFDPTENIYFFIYSHINIEFNEAKKLISEFRSNRTRQLNTSEVDAPLPKHMILTPDEFGRLIEFLGEYHL